MKFNFVNRAHGPELTRGNSTAVAEFVNRAHGPERALLVEREYWKFVNRAHGPELPADRFV